MTGTRKILHARSLLRAVAYPALIFLTTLVTGMWLAGCSGGGRGSGGGGGNGYVDSCSNVCDPACSSYSSILCGNTLNTGDGSSGTGSSGSDTTSTGNSGSSDGCDAGSGSFDGGGCDGGGIGDGGCDNDTCGSGDMGDAGDGGGTIDNGGDTGGGDSVDEGGGDSGSGDSGCCSDDGEVSVLITPSKAHKLDPQVKLGVRPRSLDELRWMMRDRLNGMSQDAVSEPAEKAVEKLGTERGAQ